MDLAQWLEREHQRNEAQGYPRAFTDLPTLRLWATLAQARSEAPRSPQERRSA